MKIFHNGEQTELDYKLPSNAQMSQVLKTSLRIKDERAKQADALFASGNLEPPKLIINGQEVSY